LPDPLAAWAINAFYSLGCFEEPVLAKNQGVIDSRLGYCAIGFRTFDIPESERARLTMLKPWHFIPRLNAAQAQKIVSFRRLPRNSRHS
jgi:hypothetical protein